MLSVGLAFKLSAGPFHFWCPDVFEGASAEVGAFLSVASKSAALALLVRVALGLTHIPSDLPATLSAPAPVATDGRAAPAATTISSPTAVATTFARASTDATDTLEPVRGFVVYLLSIVAVVTCTFGNLAAYGQANIKRMLAYSTIAHAGYMIMPVAAAITLLGRDDDAARAAVASLLIYVSVYLFMNLGAFSIVAFLRNTLRSEEIDDYAGLIRSAPVSALAMTLIVISLVGLPPLAGFIGKFAIFRSLVVAGGPLMIFLLVVAGINTAVSLVYYLRVAKRMCIDPEPDGRAAVELGFVPALYITLVSIPVVYFGIFPDRLADWAHQAGLRMFL